jgi:hypothetical protein
LKWTSSARVVQKPKRARGADASRVIGTHPRHRTHRRIAYFPSVSIDICFLSLSHRSIIKDNQSNQSIRKSKPDFGCYPLNEPFEPKCDDGIFQFSIVFSNRRTTTDDVRTDEWTTKRTTDVDIVSRNERTRRPTVRFRRRRHTDEMK